MNKRLLSLFLELCLLLSTFLVLGVTASAEDVGETADKTDDAVVGSFYYLSDMTTYTEGYGGILRQNVGWGSYQQDKNPDGGTISITMEDGTTKEFSKGIGAHAAADLVYDLGDNTTYQCLRGYFGVNSTKGGNASLSYSIYASNDFNDWGDAIYTSGTINGTTKTSLSEFDISGKRYIRIVVDPLNGNGYDHFVIGDAMVCSSDYNGKVYTSDQWIKSYDYYNDIITRALNGGTNYSALLKNEETKNALMCRMLIEKFGTGEDAYENLLNGFLNGKKGEMHRNLLNWLLTDMDALEELLCGGDPDNGTYLSALDTLSVLYDKYGSDCWLEDDLFTTAIDDDNKDRKRGDVFRTLMFSLALSGKAYSWLSSSSSIDMVDRYEQFRKVYLNKLYHLRYEIFENLCLSEMRYVTNSRIWNDEIYWVNAYLRTKYGKADTAATDTTRSTTEASIYSPHIFGYGKDWDYAGKGYLTQEGYDKYNEKYHLAEFGLTTYSTVPKLWMVFEGTHICWGISHVGANLCSAFGVPAHYGLQPGHAVYFHINRNSEGKFEWQLGNNIFGWVTSNINGSEVSSGGNGRMLCDWGTSSKGWVSYWNGSYVLLAQHALDRRTEYQNAELLMSLASYASDYSQKEALYNQVLEIMPYHLEAWHDLIAVSEKDSSVTTSGMVTLATRLGNDMKYFPLPMHDLMTLIKTTVSKKASAESSLSESEKAAAASQVVKIEKDALTACTKAATEAPSDQSQRNVAATVATSLLGNASNTIATFSFSDGYSVDKSVFGRETIDGNKIYFGQNYANARIQYSLDDGENWSEAVLDSERSIDLSEKLDQISPEKDILIWFVGWSGERTADKAYRIEINEGSSVSSTNLEANDNEDKFFGTTSGMEYSTDDGKNWYDLDNTIEFTGKQTVSVRIKANGQNVTGDSSVFDFTDNNTDEERSYIPISRMELYDFSSQETSRERNDAAYAIDGLKSTIWHTSWTANSDLNRYITIRLDEPTYLTGVDYTPRQTGTNGTFKACTVYVSMDGVNWYIGGSGSGWDGNSHDKKEITFDQAVYGQYVKIVGTDTVGNFGSASAIELFEDTSIKDKVIAGTKLVAEPTKKTYQQGEKIDLSGIDVDCVYTDGESTDVPLPLLTVDVDVLKYIGTYDVQVSYLNKVVGTFQVEVVANTRTATGLEIESAPQVTTYYANQSLNLTGLVVKATDENGSWYPTDYTVSPDGPIPYGTSEITVTYQNQTATFGVTVDREPASLEVTMPAVSEYKIGETFNPEGMTVTLKYSDNETKVLSYDNGEYSLKFRRTVGDEEKLLDIKYFSALPGEKQVVVQLAGTDLTADLAEAVTVQSYLVQGDYTYDVESSTTVEGPGAEYTCYLSCYSNTDETVVSVPAQVEVNGITYKVIGVRSNAFDNTPQITSLSLPGTIQHLEKDSLSALVNLDDLYLTGIDNINNLTIADGALPDSADGVIYMADSGLSAKLTDKLKAYDCEGEVELKLSSGSLTEDMISSVSLTPPDKLVYELDEEMDYSGLQFNAILKNGIVIPLSSNQYTITGGTNNIYGKRVVEVKYGTSFSASFEVEVLDTAPVITTHPHDQYWLSETTPTAEALSVGVEGNAEKLCYKWYMSTDATFSTVKVGDTEADQLVGTESTFTPKYTGYYYVVVCWEDSNNNESKSAQSMAAHVKLETYPVLLTHGDTQKRYPDLAKAFDAAVDGDTITVERDISVDSTITTAKSLTLKGASADVCITRDSNFSGNILNITGGEVTINNLTFHGENRTTSSSCICMSGAGKLTLGDGATIQYFRNSGSGGAVIINEASAVPELTVKGSAAIHNCFSGSLGGGIYLQSKGKVTIEGGHFYRNSASTLGGALCTNSGKASPLLISGGTFEENSSSYGGAVGVGGPSVSEITGGTFVNNTATTMGSCVCYYNGGTHSITGGVFKYSGQSGIAARSNGAGYYSELSASVTGGRFSTSPQYIAEDYKALLISDMYSVVKKSWVEDVSEEGGEVTVNFTADQTGILYVAGYDSSGKMVYVTSLQLENQESASVTPTDTEGVSIAEYRFFIVDSSEEGAFKPLYQSFSYDVTA